MIITEPHVTLEDGLVFASPLRLDNGKLVWLRTLSETIAARDPEPVPASQLIRYMSPETERVTCPGYMLVGVNVA